MVIGRLGAECHELTYFNKVTWASGLRIDGRGEKKAGRPTRRYGRSPGSWDQGGSSESGGGEWSKLGYNLKVERTGLADRSDMGCKRQSSQR